MMMHVEKIPIIAGSLADLFSPDLANRSSHCDVLASEMELRHVLDCRAERDKQTTARRPTNHLPVHTN